MAPPAPMGPRASAVTANGRTTGITVSASEMSQIPATSARIQLNVFGTQKPGGQPQSAKIDAATLQPIIDALAAAGAETQMPPGSARVSSRAWH